MALVIILPSDKVHVPKLIDVNGSWFPDLDCNVFKLWNIPSTACLISLTVISIAYLYDFW